MGTSRALQSCGLKPSPAHPHPKDMLTSIVTALMPATAAVPVAETDHALVRASVGGDMASSARWPWPPTRREITPTT